MTMIVCWLVFPLVLLALTAGCGLLVERIADVDLPGPLLPVIGLAVLLWWASSPRSQTPPPS